MHIQDVTRTARGNRYCGPSAISAVTGLTTDEAAALIRFKHNKRKVTGTHPKHVTGVLYDCGIHAMVVKVEGRPTLAGWLNLNAYRLTPGRVYLIVAGNHWQLVECDSYVCGIVRKVVPVDHEMVKRRARVTQVWELKGEYTRPALLDKIEAATAQRKAELAKVAPAKRALLKAKADGIVEWDYWDDKNYPPSILYPGEALRGLDDDADPYEGDHTTMGLEDAVEMIEAYRQLAKQLA